MIFNSFDEYEINYCHLENILFLIKKCYKNTKTWDAIEAILILEKLTE